MEVQRFFEFLTSAWAKVATIRIDHTVTSRNLLDGIVQAKGVDRERGAWQKYFLCKLKEQEDECGRSLSRTQARLEKESTNHA